MGKKYLKIVLALTLILGLVACGEKEVGDFKFANIEEGIIVESKDIKKLEADLKVLNESGLDIVSFDRGNFYGTGYGAKLYPFKLGFENNSEEVEGGGSIIAGLMEGNSPKSYYFLREKDGKSLMKLDLKNLDLEELDQIDDTSIKDLIYVGEDGYNFLLGDGDGFGYYYKDFLGEEAQELNLIDSSFYHRHIENKLNDGYVYSQERSTSGYKNLMISSGNIFPGEEFSLEEELELINSDYNYVVFRSVRPSDDKLYIYIKDGHNLTEAIDISDCIGEVSFQEGAIVYLREGGYMELIDLDDEMERKYIGLQNLEEDLSKVDIKGYRYKEAIYLQVKDRDGSRGDRFYQLAYGEEF